MNNEKIMSFSDLVRLKGYEIKPHIIGSEGFVVTKDKYYHVKVDSRVILSAPFHHMKRNLRS